MGPAGRSRVLVVARDRPRAAPQPPPARVVGPAVVGQRARLVLEVPQPQHRHRVQAPRQGRGVGLPTGGPRRALAGSARDVADSDQPAGTPRPGRPRCGVVGRRSDGGDDRSRCGAASSGGPRNGAGTGHAEGDEQRERQHRPSGTPRGRAAGVTWRSRPGSQWAHAATLAGPERSSPGIPRSRSRSRSPGSGGQTRLSSTRAVKSAARRSKVAPCRSIACFPPGIRTNSTSVVREIRPATSAARWAGPPGPRRRARPAPDGRRGRRRRGGDPRVEGDHGGHALGTARQQRRPTAQRVADQSDRQRAELLAHLVQGPRHVVERGVIGVPAAVGVQQPEHRQPPVAGAGHGPRGGHHPQDRELRGTHRARSPRAAPPWRTRATPCGSGGEATERRRGRRAWPSFPEAW